MEFPTIDWFITKWNCENRNWSSLSGGTGRTKCGVPQLLLIDITTGTVTIKSAVPKCWSHPKWNRQNQTVGPQCSFISQVELLEPKITSQVELPESKVDSWITPHKWNYQNQKWIFAVEIQQRKWNWQKHISEVLPQSIPRPKWNHGNHMSQVEQAQSGGTHLQEPLPFNKFRPPNPTIPLTWKKN